MCSHSHRFTLSFRFPNFPRSREWWGSKSRFWVRKAPKSGVSEARIKWKCRLAQPAEYDWTVYVWWRCGLFVKLLWPLVSGRYKIFLPIVIFELSSTMLYARCCTYWYWLFVNIVPHNRVKLLLISESTCYGNPDNCQWSRVCCWDGDILWQWDVVWEISHADGVSVHKCWNWS